MRGYVHRRCPTHLRKTCDWVAYDGSSIAVIFDICSDNKPSDLDNGEDIVLPSEDPLKLLVITDCLGIGTHGVPLDWLR